MTEFRGDTDPACRFQELWQQHPELATFLQTVQEPTLEQLIALVRVDQRERWTRGDRIPLERYLSQVSTLADDPEALLDLIYSEVLLREELRDQPRLEEYLGRFPRCAEALRRQWILHAALATDEVMCERPSATAHDQSASMRPAASADWPCLAGYDILGKLGSGGMGVVYKARQVQLNRLVAVKTLAAAGQQTDNEARFRQEAAAVARLQHPNIVQIFEIGDGHGQPYLALEFVDGPSLAQRCAGVPQPPRDAAQLVETLARAVHFAHQHGIIHRDLKPANILLTAHGVPKITDFGLAKQIQGAEALTLSGAILGTPSYMAPEQTTGTAGPVGPAADVYALGAVLYELLAGRPPFYGATVLDTLRQVQTQEPASLSGLRPGLPRDLDTICRKCLAKEPERRYTGADDLADDLQRFLSDQPIRARRTHPLERAWRWCRRNPTIAALSAWGALLLAAITIGAVVAAVLLKERGDLAVNATQDAQRNERKAQNLLAESYLAQARAMRATGLPGRRFESLELLRRSLDIVRADGLTSAQVLSYRSEAMACLAVADLHVDQWWAKPPSEFSYTFDRKLERVVSIDDRGTIRGRRLGRDESLVCWTPLPAAGEILDMSDDDRLIAVSYPSHRACLYDWQAQKLVLDLQATDQVTRLEFSPDGARCVYALRNGRILLQRLDEPGPPQQVGSVPSPERLAFSPAGDRIAVASWSGPRTQIISWQTAQPPLLLAHPRTAYDIAWHPDGKTVATACGDGRLYLWDAVSGAKRGTLPGHEGAATGIGFTHAGDLLASGGWDGVARLWDLPSRRQIAVGPYLNIRPRFSPDDRKLAGAWDGRSRIGIMQVGGGEASRTLTGGRQLVGSLARVDFHKDGRLLAAAGQEGFDIWDVDARRRLGRQLLPATGSGFFAAEGDVYFTAGDSGLLSWPLRTAAADAPGQWILGPPRLLSKRQATRAVRTADGSAFITIIDHQAPLLVDAKTVGSKPFGGLDSYVALSPDGTLCATGSWTKAGVRVHRVPGGEPVCQLTTGLRTNVLFSPDGKQLVTSTPTEYGFWHTKTWKKDAVLPKDGDTPGEMAFTADGTLLAVSASRTQVQLVDPESRAVIAVLHAPTQHEILSLCFSPDTTRLAVLYAVDVIHIWDLRPMRAGLAELDLDWNLKPYPAPPRRDMPLQTMRIQAKPPRAIPAKAS